MPCDNIDKVDLEWNFKRFRLVKKQTASIKNMVLYETHINHISVFELPLHLIHVLSIHTRSIKNND